jgi:hypothetical protein
LIANGIKLNELRREVILTNWLPEYGPRLCETVVATLKSEPAFTDSIRLAMSLLLKKPEILGTSDGDQVATQLASVLQRAANDEDRTLVRDCMIAAAIASPAAGKQTALVSLSSYWQSDSDEQIRRDLKLAQSFPENDVPKLIIESQMAEVTRELESPSDRTLERVELITEFGQLAPPHFFRDQFSLSLSVTSDVAYMFWRGVIADRLSTLAVEDAAALIDTALQLVTAPSTLKLRKTDLLMLVTELLATQPAAKQAAITQRMCELLWHAVDIVRNSAANAISFLRPRANLGDVRIHINAGIHEYLSKVGVGTFQQYRPVVDALVANKDLWNEGSSRSMSQLAVTLSSNETLRGAALDLFESIDKFDDGDRPDVINALIMIKTVQTDLADRAQQVLRRIAPGSERLGTEYRETSVVDGDEDKTKLNIRSAMYGAEGHAWKDVTSVLSAKIQNGKLRVPITNAELGGDPVPNVVKQLEVTYSEGGQTYQKTIPENEMLSVPEP